VTVRHNHPVWLMAWTVLDMYGQVEDQFPDGAVSDTIKKDEEVCK